MGAQGRRWLPWIMMALVLAVALVIGSSARSGSETVSQRVDRIAKDVRCPSCSGLSVAESDAPTAVAVRQLITDQVKAGRSDGSIETDLVHSYGSGILLRPPASGVAAVVWVLPAVAGAVGVIALLVVFRRRRLGGDRGSTPSAEDRALVEQALR
ncbi:MAG TPA: cytochrome c-type biogenesis protein CcmH [Acidimicrobiales bacterium]